MMDHLLCIVLLLTVYLLSVEATELTFELPDNEKQCFFEKIDKGVKSTLEFQVSLLLLI